ncbi:hypothetical protein CTAYLR_006152 [Chrysophaeum taylorii]|uniref:Uncharacterized protein n=1 Tax=Chrysophaeum taylorii TaxID=2483200 RepID=A0AAD7UNV8_9STRA|nr:hypothetical protein CTAYLR_006152 [Chrysophaeum taylorii]
MAEVRPAEEERVHAIVDGGRAANVFTSLSAVPLIGGVCDVAKKILDDVREYEGNAEDAAEAGRCVLDVLDFLLVLTRREDALPEKREDKVREAMEDLELLLGDFKAAVQEFGTRGFFKRAWNLRKYNVGTLSRIDGMIRDKLDFLANLYGLARDARVVQHSPRVMPYKLEAVLLKYVDERHDSDEKALQDAATVGGVHPEETRAALAALDYSQDQSPPLLEEKNYSRLKELIFLLKRAVERGDAAAVRLAGKTVSEVMAKTCLLTIYRKCLVVQLLAASFADDAKTIGALLERAPEIIHEMLSDVGGAALALSALHISAMRGNIDAVKKLKNMNGDFTIPDACKRTPLHHAAARGHAKVISYFLLHCGVDVNAKDRDDWTALMCASHEGFLNVVERLVEIGYADVNSGRLNDHANF